MLWLQLFEAWAITRLLRSPVFHRAVGSVHKKVRQLREGKTPEELEEAIREAEKKEPTFVKHFLEELRNQSNSGNNLKK